MSWEVREGDCLDVLRTLDAGSVQTCVTSPPYWGLRDYGEEGQLGLEPTPEEYVANLVEVFREVRRALRDDGTVWLNLGDSYCGALSQHHGLDSVGPNDKVAAKTRAGVPQTGRIERGKALRESGLKPKDLVGIPWRVAFALQADGWWLRSDIIWSKPNPMPESVTDRPTRAHEYIFLLSKAARYFYDADAIREDHQTPVGANGRFLDAYGREMDNRNGGRSQVERRLDNDGKGRPRGVGATANPAGRNRRSVWQVATKPYSEAHFATFPPNLIEPCILAGSPTYEHRRQSEESVETMAGMERPCAESGEGATEAPGSPETAPAVVLDPFAGAGTTGLVATQHGLDFIGIELNPEYAEMARERIRRYEANPAGALEGDPEPIEGQIGLL